MEQENKTVVYDEQLHIEAYRFQGFIRPFPNHFHNHYVIGLVEAGERVLTCKNREYHIGPGSILLFNPGDSHACAQKCGELDYLGLNLSAPVMEALAGEITGLPGLPGFSQNVAADEETACCLRSLHGMLLSRSIEFEKEETLLLLLTRLLSRFGQPFALCIPECREEIARACAFMDEHLDQRISLDQLCRHAGLSRSTLLRAFTREKGVTPYRYLETVRIEAAKKLLEQGVSPAETALRTGFSDQSHFTNYFSRFIGLSPGAYRDIFSGGAGTEGDPHGT